MGKSDTRRDDKMKGSKTKTSDFALTRIISLSRAVNFLAMVALVAMTLLNEKDER